VARLSERLPENEGGLFFVDTSCIDCDLCRQIAPGVFARADRPGQSYVRRQPRTDEERLRAGMALATCPTSSIGTAEKVDLRPALEALPERVEDEVSFCGFAAESSFGASSYFIQRPGGNVLVDSPRWAGSLVKKLEAMGGVSLMFLTHQDDVADHERYAAHFGCRRVIHRADAGRFSSSFETVDGDAPVSLAPDLLVIPVPGHTRGSAALLYRDRFLFTGDHLAGADEGDGLEAWPSVCWYSWTEQTRSMERLLDLRFEWVLPGHGRRLHAPAEQMRRHLEALVGWMRGRRGRAGRG